MSLDETKNMEVLLDCESNECSVEMDDCCKAAVSKYSRRCAPFLKMHNVGGIRLPIPCEVCGATYKVTFTGEALQIP